MSVVTLRNSIHHLVDEVQDEHLLISFNALLADMVRIQSQTIVGYSADLQKITKKELRQRALQSEHDIEVGSISDIENLLNDSE
jgi:hypothetical protein